MFLSLLRPVTVYAMANEASLVATRTDQIHSALDASGPLVEYCVAILWCSGGLGGGVLCVTRLRDQTSLLVTRDISSPRSEGGGDCENSHRSGLEGVVWYPVDRVERVMDQRRQVRKCGPVISPGSIQTRSPREVAPQASTAGGLGCL